MLRSVRICQGVGVGALVVFGLCCAPGDFQVCFLEQVGNEYSLFASIHVCECCPFMFSGVCFFYGCGGVSSEGGLFVCVGRKPIVG